VYRHQSVYLSSAFQRLVGTITFEDEKKAENFKNDILRSVQAKGQGENYFWNFGQKIEITRYKCNVIIKWSYEFAKTNE
jgi:hypothetical protein